MRRSIYIDEFAHKSPIPNASRIGNIIVSGLLRGVDPATQAFPPTVEQQCSFMFDNIYLGPIARRETVRAGEMVEALLEHYVAGGDELPGRDGDDAVTRASDWVAGMTDRYCMRAYDELLALR